MEFQRKFLGVQMNTTNQNTNSGSKPTNSFKTAHEQLFIDQQNKKQRGVGGASSSSSSITQVLTGGVANFEVKLTIKMSPGKRIVRG